MTYVKVKGFKIFADRHGKERCYHRATGVAIDLEKHPLGSAGFFAECNRISARLDDAANAKPGTLGMLIERYRASQAFLGLAARTRSDYQRVFNYVQPLADEALIRFNTPLIVQIRDKAGASKGWHFGNMVRSILRLLFTWGRERGFVKDNPALGVKAIKRPKNAPEANRPWSDTERENVMVALPAHMRLPVALMMYSGLDPQDALRLPRTAIIDGKIDTKRGKTATPIWLPVIAPLQAEVAAAPKHDAITLCANSYGRPWTVSGFRASWQKVRKKLEIAGKIQPGLTLKGLRHTVATILSEMGFGPEIIREMLGQKTDAMARLYSRRADVGRKLAAPIADFEAEMDRRRTKVVKPA
jgi:integrase